jgi:hypothetical protein
MNRLITVMLLIFGTATFSVAGIHIAPEIDPTTGVAAVALIGSALLIIRGRRKK